MSYGFQGAKSSYPEIDKQYYVVYKYVKHFRPFLLKSHTKVIVPHAMVTNLSVQKYLGEKFSFHQNNSTSF